MLALRCGFLLARFRLISHGLCWSRLIGPRLRLILARLRGGLSGASGVRRRGRLPHGYRRRRTNVVVGRERPGSDNHLRAAVIHSGEVASIGFCRLHLLDLRGHGRGVLLADSDHLRGPRSNPNTARSVVAHSVRVVVHNPVVVDVAYHIDIHVIDGAVVVEVVAVPVATLVA